MGKVHSIKNGFGFIKPDEGTVNIFFHYSVVADGDFNYLKRHNNVEFRISRDAPQRGKFSSADEVRKI